MYSEGGDTTDRRRMHRRRRRSSRHREKEGLQLRIVRVGGQVQLNDRQALALHGSV